QIIPLSNIDNFLSWRNGYWGILLNGRGTEVTNSIFIGNIRGGNIGFQGDSNVVQNSHAIGEVDDDRKPSRSGVVFASGHNNILKDSILEGHTESLPRSSADVRVRCGCRDNRHHYKYKNAESKNYNLWIPTVQYYTPNGTELPSSQ
ncbi:MAG: hypothetical protein V3T40_01755, partial [Nitrososphaerales archaeon]